MNHISPALKAHYALPTTTLAQCWLVTLQNGTQHGFTTNSSDIAYPPTPIFKLGTTPYASSGDAQTAITAALAVDLANNPEGTVTTDAIAFNYPQGGGKVYSIRHIGASYYADSWLTVADVPQVRYLAATGHIPSNVQSTSAMNVDNMECQGMLQSPTITDEDLLAGLWDYALVELIEVNYKDLTMGCRIIRTGNIGHVSTGRNTFKAEVRGLMQTLQQTVGRVYSDLCDADLGDARCKVAAGLFKTSGVAVSGVSDGRTFTATMTKPSGYFSRGNFTWKTGANAGRVGEVRTFVASDQFTLQLLAPYPIQVGDTFDIVAGCDKSIATCECTFGNSSNFRGFFTVPGQDRMISGT